MSKENSAGLGVNNFYGPRPTPDGATGVFKTEGALNELAIEISGQNINDDAVNHVLPAGTKLIEAIVDVEEVFALGGTTPTVEVGTNTTEATNGVSISEAIMEAVGTTVITTFNGTWANRLAATTTVGIALGGTSPTVTAAGNARIVLRYANV